MTTHDSQVERYREEYVMPNPKAPRSTGYVDELNSRTQRPSTHGSQNSDTASE